MYEKQPIVSVIMPVYNREAYIAEAIESVLNQTFIEFELIVVDDKSVDRSLEIIQRYACLDDRIKVISNLSNKGPGASRNIALSQAKGKYIALMDSDDVCLPDRFEKQTKYLEENSEVWILGSNVVKIDSRGNKIGVWNLPQKQYLLRWHMIFKSSGIFCAPTVMARREFFELLSGFDETLRLCDDLEMWTRIFNHPEIGTHNLSDVLALYRVHNNSITVGNGVEQSGDSTRVRAQVLSSFLQKKVDPITIAAYESGQDLCKDQEKDVILTWFETYALFIKDYKLSAKERSLIYQEMLSRTISYTSILPWAKSEWVFNFLPHLGINHVVSMIFVKIYHLASKLKLVLRGK